MRGVFIEPPAGSGSGGAVDSVTGTDGQVTAAPTTGDVVLTTFLKSVERDLTTEEIATITSSPVTLVAAQGANAVIIPVSATIQLLAGTEPFANNRTFMLGPGGAGLLTAEATLIDTDPLLVPLLVTFVEIGTPDAANEPLLLTANNNPGLTGSILTASLGSGGAGYLNGDTITLEADTGTAAVITVSTTGGGGAVATFAITNPGTRYPAGVGREQDSTSGIGTGFSLVVDTITALTDITGRITVVYYVMPLAT